MGLPRFILVLWILTATFAQLCLAEPPGIDFRADFYQRDLGTNTLKGRGNVWVRNKLQELWADEIEADFNTNRAIARGNVHIKQGDQEIWADEANFNLVGDDATLDNATVATGQMIAVGETITKFSSQEFEITQGTYTNCNVLGVRRDNARNCPFDWKIYARRLHITLGEYGHFYEVLFQARDLPVVYTPYLIIPIKTERQTGFLIPGFRNRSTLGSGIQVPLFLALSDWQDMLLTYTHFSTAGFHFASNYRYAYDDRRFGSADMFFLQRRFGEPGNPGPDDTGRDRTLGLFGESAFRVRNLYKFSGRTRSLQQLYWVSDRYYTFDYWDDFGPIADLGYLRSQAAISSPTDDWFFAARIQHNQSLVVSKDSGVDRGPVTELPTLMASQVTQPLLGQFLSYEWDATFTNFYRPDTFDEVPNTLFGTGINADATPGFDANDYLRTGKRLHLEPRLVVSVPMPGGFQFQPVLKGGSLLYQFDLGSTTSLRQDYVNVELPLALQMSKTYRSELANFQRISHVVQPRLIYANSLYQGSTGDHEFLFRDVSRNLSNPRFDILDQVTPFEYLRFELINRFRRKKDNGTVERFFWFQLAQQYNLRTSAYDPRYSKQLGNLEILSALTVDNFVWTTQAGLPLEEPRDPVVDPGPVISTGIKYQLSFRDHITLTAFGAHPPSSTDHWVETITLSTYKTLPTFFDVRGALDFNFRTHQFQGYQVGIVVARKPNTCWNFSLTTGQDAYGQSYTQLGFGLDFGKPHAL